MSFKVYRWDDADAPVLDTSYGSLINVLKKCLVDGYGSGEQARTPPDPAWNVDESGDDHHAVFNSTDANSLGHYLYVREDGELDGDPTGDTVLSHAREVYVKGAIDLLGWSNGRPDLDGVFPKPENMARGAAWYKRSQDSNSDPACWVLVADARTFYLMIGNYATDGASAANYQDPYGTLRFAPVGFGDLRTVGGETPASILLGGDSYNSTSSRTGFNGSIFYDGENSFPGIVCSTSSDGTPGGRIVRWRRDNNYFGGSANGTVPVQSVSDLSGEPLWEMPLYCCLTADLPYLWALRGLREPSLRGDETIDTEHFFYQLIGVAEGDPLMGTVSIDGYERFVIPANSAGNSGCVLFFDLEDDQ